jgi:hypothetical protein
MKLNSNSRKKWNIIAINNNRFFPFLFSVSLLIVMSMTVSVRSSFAQSPTQAIRGIITDMDSKEPLIGSIVQVPELNLGTTTDETGSFKITNVPVGRYDIVISYMGYENQTLSDVIVTAGKEVIINPSLSEKINELDEVIVAYDRTEDKTVTNNDMTVVSSRSFNIEDTKKYAGSLGDPSRMAANFAGVSGANDARNDIIIRGNSPAGLLWQLEGLNIPNPNHFGSLGSTGGPVSMLNNNVLAKSDFMTSAFPAAYGNALSGVFDLRLREGNNEKHEFLAQLGFNGFEAGAEGPFSKSSKSSYLINYRYSTLALFQKIGLDFGTGSATPDYQDLNFKLNFKVRNGNISVFGLGGLSDAKFLGNETDTTKLDFYSSRYENTIVNYKTGIAGISYGVNITPKTFSKLTLGISATEENYHGDSISNITLQTFARGNSIFKTQKYSLVYDISHKFNAKNTVSAGLTEDLIRENLFNEEILEGTIHRTYLETDNSSLLSQAYGQWKHRFNDKITFKGGLNILHLSGNGAFALNPRAGFTYRVAGNQTINIGYGLVSRMQPLTLYSVQTPVEDKYIETNKNLGFTNAHHVVVGYDWLVSENLDLKAETYYQYLFDVPVEMNSSSYSAINSGDGFGPDLTDSLVNSGSGRNYGIELTAEKYFSNNYYFLVTASIFDSKYKGSDGILRNTAYNQHYVLNLLGGKEFLVGRKKNALGLDVKFTTAGGKYLTPIDLTASEAEGHSVYETNKAFSVQQDPYLRLDTKLYFRKNFRNASMEIALDLQNLTNHKNIFSQEYDEYSNTIVTEYQQGFFPIPSFKLTF